MTIVRGVSGDQKRMRLDARLRVTIAGLVSPLSMAIVVPLVDFCLHSGWRWTSAEFSKEVGVGLGVAIFAYPVMLIFGLPAYLMLWRLSLASLWTAAVVGFVGVLTAPYLIELLLNLMVAVKNGVWLAMPHWSVPPTDGLYGSLVGMVFWSIARPDLDPYQTSD